MNIPAKVNQFWGQLVYRQNELNLGQCKSCESSIAGRESQQYCIVQDVHGEHLTANKWTLLNVDAGRYRVNLHVNPTNIYSTFGNVRACPLVTATDKQYAYILFWSLYVT